VKTVSGKVGRHSLA